jgi:hypothetical protein
LPIILPFSTGPGQHRARNPGTESAVIDKQEESAIIDKLVESVVPVNELVVSSPQPPSPKQQSTMHLIWFFNVSHKTVHTEDTSDIAMKKI